MKAFLPTIIFVFILQGCSPKTNETYFKPYVLEDGKIVRASERKVTQEDIDILQGALSLLKDEKQWNKKDTRMCVYETKHSLFCALAKASIKVLGEYDHRRVALQEVRYIIDERYHDRWEAHRLKDFNNHHDTTLTEVKEVLRSAKKRLEKRLISSRSVN